MPSFNVRVDLSSAYSSKGRSFGRSIIKVEVNESTKVSEIKSSVLIYLNLPYSDLYVLDIKGKELADQETVSDLQINEKSLLLLKCKNIEELYNRMRADRRL